MYLDLLKRCLVNSIYPDADVDIMSGIAIQDDWRINGLCWSSFAHTMIGLKRLDNLQFACETAIKEQIPGDFMETGVWRGGACIFMRAVLQYYNDKIRRVWVADSFQGVPAPDTAKFPADVIDMSVYKSLVVSLETVRENFSRYALLDDQVQFLPGWFRHTLPTAPVERLAVLRLDGDLYESTMDALASLYRKVSPGGFVIIDDYGCVDLGCSQAVDDFRVDQQITDEIVPIDASGIYWRKMV